MLGYLLTPVLLVTFVIGLVLAPTPIPVGVPIMALSVFLLIATNPHAARVVLQLRCRHGWIDRGMRFVEDRAHGRFGDVLRRTRPPDNGPDRQ